MLLICSLNSCHIVINLKIMSFLQNLQPHYVHSMYITAILFLKEVYLCLVINQGVISAQFTVINSLQEIILNPWSMIPRKKIIICSIEEKNHCISALIYIVNLIIHIKRISLDTAHWGQYIRLSRIKNLGVARNYKFQK